MDPVRHCNHFVGEEGSDYFAFRWFVACLLSVMVCLLVLLVSLVGYDLKIVALLWHRVYYFFRYYVSS